MPTGLELDLKKKKEERLQDVSERKTRPWLSQLLDLDELGRGAIYLSVFVLAAVLILWAFGFDMKPVYDAFMNLRIYAVLLALSVIFYRDVVSRLVIEGFRRLLRWDREAREARRRKWLLSTQRGEKSARENAADPDAYEGVPITLISQTIAEEPKGTLSRPVLESLSLPTKKVLALQAVLKNAQFPVYRFTARADSLPVGYENVAILGGENNVTTVLHPTLMTMSLSDRGAIVANAIRSAMGYPLGPEPKVHGELSERGRPLTGLKGAQARDIPINGLH